MSWWNAAMPVQKKKLGFLKTTLLGAVLVVVPVGIIGFSLWQVVKLVKALLLPMMDWLDFDSVVTEVSVIVGALLLVVLLCYLTGVAVRTRWGQRMRRWFESSILEKIPGYSMIRTLVHQYLGHEEEKKFRPVLVDQHGTGALTIGFEIEDLGNGFVAVFFPSVPAVTLGGVEIVPEARVTPIKASMHDTLEALTMFGVGVSKLLADDAKTQVPQGGGDTVSEGQAGAGQERPL